VLDSASLLIAVIVLLILTFCLLVLNIRRHQTDLRDREQRLRLALWATGEYYWDFNLSSRKVSWLQGTVRTQEHPSSPTVTSTPTESTVDVLELLHPEDMPRVQAILDAYLNGQAPNFEAEFRIQRTNGWCWIRVRGRVVSYDASRATRIAGTALDISATHIVERERQIAGQVLGSMAEAVAVVDQELNFVSINPAFLQMTGYEREEVIGTNMRLLESHQHHHPSYEHITQTLQHSGHWSGEIWQRGKHDENFLCTLTFTTISATLHLPRLHVAVFNDITRQKHAEQRLHYLTNFDPLTNLPNRTWLTERLLLSIVTARRSHKKVAVLFLDLDRFRDVNEQVGPAIGDNILRAVAQRLQQTLPGHTVARLGGDEFAVVLGNLDDADTSERIAQQILTAFDSPLTLGEHVKFTVFFSIGISLYPNHALNPDDLLKQADIAMYQAKAGGRRTFMRYDRQMDTKTRQRTAISSTLRKVLERSELTLAFQPRLELATSRITSVEVLLRWFNREHGEIDPANFIPLAEESGMIMEISQWALKEACLTLSDWRRQGLPELRMSVNVSLLQLLRDNFPEMVQGILQDTRVPPQALELELTETMLMVDTEYTANTLQVFRDMGVSVAVDDFGTGYSSLAYLKQLPVDTLKIDKTFIKDLHNKAEDATIVTSIIHMGHSLGLKVVAEGVETNAQQQFLLSQGCDEIQGFWLAKPLAAAQALTFIQHWSSSPRPQILGGVNLFRHHEHDRRELPCH